MPDLENYSSDRPSWVGRRLWRNPQILIAAILFLTGLACTQVGGMQLVEIERLDATPVQPIVIVDNPAPAPVVQVQAPTVTPLPTLTPIPTETPTPAPTFTPVPFLSQLSMPQQSDPPNLDRLPRHGLVVTLLLPLILFGLPWTFLEISIARYVRPRSLDLTRLLIKAQDGLFIETVVSMTAHKNLSLASLAIRWPGGVRGVVEKAIEQELIQAALEFRTLGELESNLTAIVQRLTELEVIRELERDFGVAVMRFNIELRYPPETVDAINRRAEAVAGGQAYIAYAQAAHLDPDGEEAQELYKIYQQTTSSVDAARSWGVDAIRSIGDGFANLATLISQSPGLRRMIEEDDNDDQK